MSIRHILLAGALSASLAAGAFTTPAFASNGVFDALDPCIQATDNFRDARENLMRQFDAAVADADNAAVPQWYRNAWLKAKKAVLRNMFDEALAPPLKDSGVTDLDAAYENWFKKQLDAIGPEKVDQIQTASFRQELKEIRIEQRTKGEGELKAGSAELSKSCKMDVGNQALRGVLTVTLAPVGMISRNLEIAKRERGAIAKGLAATTGISVDAINANGGVFGGGLSGGPNSFFRKNLGIRF